MKFKMHFTLLVRETLHQKASTGNIFLENLAVENWMQGGNTKQAYKRWLSQELEECRAEAKQSKQLLSAEALVEKSKMVQVPSLSSSLKFLK